MPEYKYRVSIIVPVYNVEKFLGECLDSLLNQSMPKDETEILLINDGSTDASLEICRKYAAKNACIKLFTKENEGLSATRNYGIARATGKYIMYVDSDDMLTPETVKNVVDYFDTVCDKVDMVSYFEQPYNSKGNLRVHYRFRYYLKKTGIYDLNKTPYIVQTRVNVCVKNMFEDNILFDITPGFMQEDQEYNNRILKDKFKIGYCAQACYRYNKSNENSIVKTRFSAENLFETSTSYFERIFEPYGDKIPPYFQAMFVNDIYWKLNEGKLFPLHYEEQKFIEAVNRIKALLSKVDTDILLSLPLMSEEHRNYWLSMKPNANLTVYTDGESTGLLHKGDFLFKESGISVKLLEIKPDERGKLRAKIYVCSPVYSHIAEEAEIYICENGDESSPQKLVSYPSKLGYTKSVHTGKYYEAEYIFDPNRVKSFRHYVKLDGYYVAAVYSFTPETAFLSVENSSDKTVGEAKIIYKDNCFYCEQSNIITEKSRAQSR